jgi:hypothetical protein
MAESAKTGAGHITYAQAGRRVRLGALSRQGFPIIPTDRDQQFFLGGLWGFGNIATSRHDHDPNGRESLVERGQDP